MIPAPTIEFVDDAGFAAWSERLAGLPVQLVVRAIGKSRAGRAMWGYVVGEGPLKVSLVAGAHADEPAGPLALMNLLVWLGGESDEAAELRKTATFVVVPQVNPDGAEANREWFDPVVDIGTYLFHVKREGPGDDIEFGYPAMRPENEAVAGFLCAHGPYGLHMSLHGMAMAAGAWFLIGRNHISETRELQVQLAELAARHGFGLHDIDRQGDKGFTRIAKGFCTTPESEPMRKHFLALNDPETAGKFHQNSMEYVQSLGGNPLVMVSELPIFAVDGQWGEEPRLAEDPFVSPAPTPGSTHYEKLKKNLSKVPVWELVDKYKVVPVPFDVQVKVLMEMVVLAVRHCRKVQ